MKLHYILVQNKMKNLKKRIIEVKIDNQRAILIEVDPAPRAKRSFDRIMEDKEYVRIDDKFITVEVIGWQQIIN